MNKMTCLAICWMMVQCVSAQFIHDVDIAPMVTDCSDQVLSDRPVCSESFIISYFLDEIDKDLCSASDSSHIYKLQFDIDARGKIMDVKLKANNFESPCKSYFEDRLQVFASEQKFDPAKKDKKKVDFRKQVNIIYPPKTPDLNSEDSGPMRIDEVDVRPRFLGCEDMIGSDTDKENCGMTKMLMSIYRNLRYPYKARDKGIEGTVLCKFVINEAGYLEGIFIKEDIGGGCGQEVLKVVNSLNEFSPPFRPAYFRGQPVKVHYLMPVRFKLG